MRAALVCDVISWIPYGFDITVEHVCVCCASKPSCYLVPKRMLHAPVVAQILFALRKHELARVELGRVRGKENTCALQPCGAASAVAAGWHPRDGWMRCVTLTHPHTPTDLAL